jgi:hypothetical protein
VEPTAPTPPPAPKAETLKPKSLSQNRRPSSQKSLEPKSEAPKAKAEEAVVARQMALSPEQKAALLTELDTDTNGLIDMLVDDPARVDAAIDRIEAAAAAPKAEAPTLQGRIDALSDEDLLVVQAPDGSRW